MNHKIHTKYKFAFIGCGLIGHKRAKSISKKSIIGCYDIDKIQAKKFSDKFDCKNYDDYNELIKNSDIVLICTPHSYLDKFTLLSAKLGKHILVEKPAAVSLKAIKLLINKVKNKNLKIHVGFNHRFHPSIIKAIQMVKKKDIGDLMYVRSRYGHGARKNYHKEWRMNQLISGGGELIDQGSHIIDLSRVFLGEFTKINSVLKTCFWKSKVEDNAFLTLRKINFLLRYLEKKEKLKLMD